MVSTQADSQRNNQSALSKRSLKGVTGVHECSCELLDLVYLGNRRTVVGLITRYALLNRCRVFRICTLFRLCCGGERMGLKVRYSLQISSKFHRVHLMLHARASDLLIKEMKLCLESYSLARLASEISTRCPFKRADKPSTNNIKTITLHKYGKRAQF
jgi:hypothetical protein